MPTTSKLLSLLVLATLAAPGSAAAPGAPMTSCAAAPVVAPVDSCSDTPSAAPARPATLTRGRLFHQIRYHLTLPASRPRILASLAATAELSPDEATWIAAALPRRSFATGAEVLVTLFPDTPADVLARVEARAPAFASR